MVLRREAIRERLLHLEEVLSQLAELGHPDGAELRQDFRTRWTVERGLQLAAEISFDIGNHILSAHFGASARDYEDILEQLAARGVIEGELRERLRGLGGFRNILVHGYLRIDSDRVSAGLSTSARDFSEFSLAIGRWLEALGS